MNMMMKLGEVKLVATVGGAVPPMGHSHHLPHLLLLLAEGQVGQELSLRLLPGQGAGRAGRTVGHHQALPLLDEGVGQLTNLFTKKSKCKLWG